MSIPKIIHYCWFGNSDKPEDLVKYMNTWKSLKGYKIIEWNETNFNIDSNEYVRENYKNGKYAFVSDYARLKILYEYGGIYLDTDIEIKKSFDDFLNDSLFIGFMFDCNLGTAVIGSKKNNNVIKDIISLYDNLKLNNSPNNDLFTKFFIDNYSEFKLNGKYQVLNNEVSIYPKNYFERPTYDKKAGYSVHHYKGSWYGKKDRLIKKIVRSILGDVIYGELSHYRALKMSPFYNKYLIDKKKL